MSPDLGQILSDHSPEGAHVDSEMETTTRNLWLKHNVKKYIIQGKEQYFSCKGNNQKSNVVFKTKKMK